MAPPPTAVLAGTRRKLCDTIEDDLQNNQQQKKRKLSTTATQTQALITPPVEKSDASPTANAVEEAFREDPITAENVNFAQVRIWELYSVNMKRIQLTPSIRNTCHRVLIQNLNSAHNIFQECSQCPRTLVP
jgi:hypothetical protein